MHRSGEDLKIASRLALTMRGGRLLERLPRLTVYTAAELALLVLLAVQGARLIWILAAPPAPVGDWKASSALALPASSSVLAGFDPFFRLTAGGPVVVTSLNLVLHGVREDRATGRGSAIIALPDGRQMSFAVGEEIMPGVTLTAVGFDNVTIARAGIAEQLFLDQSEPAPAVGGAAPPVPGQQIAAPTPQAGPFGGSAMNFQPRVAGNSINGIIVTPGADGGQAFRAAGFEPGDVIVSVNGQRITSIDQARSAAAGAGGEVSVMVDRGGRAVALRLRLNP
jgi:general secretion pathway protein C